MTKTIQALCFGAALTFAGAVQAQGSTGSPESAGSMGSGSTTGTTDRSGTGSTDIGNSGSTMGSSGAASPTKTSAQQVLSGLHSSNQEEIAMGKLAQQNGTRRVKGYADKLVKDHTRADEKVMGIAREEKVQLSEAAAPDKKDAAHASMERLSTMKGEAFDTAFLSAMVDDHTRDISELRTARPNIEDRKVSKLVDDMIPQLEKHRTEARKLLDTGSRAQGRKGAKHR